MAASANEVTIDDFNAAEEIAVTNSRVDGLEARFNNLEAGSFSETTTASFGVDFLVGAVDGASSEATTFDYQMGIGLETSFTGEDSLSATIDIGNGASAVASADGLNFDSTSDVLTLDGLTYTFPVGGATVMVGDNTDISAVYTGACAYSAFTDYMGNCGTGNSVGVGGNGATAAMSYAFDSGFSLAGGVSSTPTSLLTEEGTDTYGVEAAYTADSYGVAVAFVNSDNGYLPETTYWGVNGYYSFDLADLSVGYETEENGGTDKTGYFVGLTFDEVGPGSVNVAAATTGNFADSETETLIYEASYSYAVNDGMTITPGVFIKEVASGDDLTGIAVKTSFSF
jgi:hypothetical protein